MTDLLLFVFLSFVLKNVDLLTLAILNYGCSYISTFNGGLACNKAITGYSENFFKFNFFAFSCVEFFYENNVAFLNFVLLSACYDNCEYWKSTSLSYHDSLSKANNAFCFLRP